MPELLETQLKELAESIITQMKTGTDQWYMPWHQGLKEPVNLVTGRVFKGRNAAILWNASCRFGYKRNEWATLKQWSKRRGKVRLGSKGVRVFVPLHNLAADLFGGKTPELTGFRSYHVFNVEQINNFNPQHPDLFDENTAEIIADQHIDTLVKRSGADIRYEGDRACYLPKPDKIMMPPRSAFIQTRHTTPAEGFYSTLVHEIVHWTKRRGRSPRQSPFDDSQQAYAFEELVAELGAAMICTRFGQRVEPRPDHAAYLSGWLTLLENDFRYFYQALYLAQEAVHWLYRHTNMVPEGWVLDDQSEDAEEKEKVKEKAKGRAEEIGAVLASDVRVDQPGLDGSYMTTMLLSVTCGACEEHYSIALIKGEEVSRCPLCYRVNLHPIPV